MSNVAKFLVCIPFLLVLAVLLTNTEESTPIVTATVEVTPTIIVEETQQPTLTWIEGVKKTCWDAGGDVVCVDAECAVIYCTAEGYAPISGRQELKPMSDEEYYSNVNSANPTPVGKIILPTPMPSP